MFVGQEFISKVGRVSVMEKPLQSVPNPMPVISNIATHLNIVGQALGDFQPTLRRLQIMLTVNILLRLIALHRCVRLRQLLI